MYYWPRIRELGQSLDQGWISLASLTGEFESHLREEVLKDYPKKGRGYHLETTERLSGDGPLIVLDQQICHVGWSICLGRDELDQVCCLKLLCGLLILYVLNSDLLCCDLPQSYYLSEPCLASLIQALPSSDILRLHHYHRRVGINELPSHEQVS